MSSSNLSLRKIILEKTGQDLRKCRGCMDCDFVSPENIDLGYGSLVQLILMNDKDVLGSKLIWDGLAFEKASKACSKQLDLRKVIEVLREIEVQEGLEEGSG